MARATQLLAYHGRTALLLGPVPRRANMVAANQSGPVRPHAKTAPIPMNDEIHPAMLSTSRLLSLLLDAQPDAAQAVPTPPKARVGQTAGKTGVVLDLAKRKMDSRG